MNIKQSKYQKTCIWPCYTQTTENKDQEKILKEKYMPNKKGKGLELQWTSHQKP